MLGSPKDDKVRSIKVKFARCNTKSKIFGIKKMKSKKSQQNKNSDQDASRSTSIKHARSLNFIMLGPTTEKSCTKMWSTTKSKYITIRKQTLKAYCKWPWTKTNCVGKVVFVFLFFRFHLVFLALFAYVTAFCM